MADLASSPRRDALVLGCVMILIQRCPSGTEAVPANTMGLIAALFLCTLLASCSSSAEPGRTQDGGGEAGDAARVEAGASGGGGGGNGFSSSIFTDPKVPRCGDGTTTQHQMRGTIDGAAVTVGSSAFSDLIKGQYRHVRAVAGEVYDDLVLTWEGPLELDREVSLTGESLVVPKEHPKAGKQVCITSGTFGVTRADGGVGVQVLFKLTGARDGDCVGPALPIDVVACTFRRNTNLP